MSVRLNASAIGRSSSLRVSARTEGKALAPSLVDQVAIVTGAGSGIGAMSAASFADAGARVVAADVDEGSALATAKRIRESGGDALAVRCDVADEAAVRALVAEAVQSYGRLDIAHNNAGIDGDMASRLADLSTTSWERVLAVNLTGVFLCMKHEIPVMLENGGGAIVNTSSVAGLRGLGKSAAYGASKHGVVGLTRIAALDYASSGIRVNAVCPGAIETAMLSAAKATNPRMIEGLAKATPMKRVGKPAEIADLVVWLCSDEASYLTGQAISVDGGLTAS